MAKQTVVQLIDDISGEAGDETVQFALDGVNYEIDLSKENAEQLRADFETYTQAARRVKGAPSTARKPTRSDRTENAAIRAWAKDQGIQIGDKGRIPAEVITAYRAGH